jgi:hypothetical protein
MINKQYILTEDDYLQLCNDLERIHVDIHFMVNRLDDRETLKKYLIKSHQATNKLLKDLRWSD